MFADYGKKWKNAPTAILNILAPKSITGFDEILQKEARNCLNLLMKETKIHGDVNPFSFVRCSSINVILSTGFGTMPGVISPEDPLFKEIEHAV
jgi:hypothetical protein